MQREEYNEAKILFVCDEKKRNKENKWTMINQPRRNNSLERHTDGCTTLLVLMLF